MNMYYAKIYKRENLFHWNHNATFIKNLKIEDYNLLIEIKNFLKKKNVFNKYHSYYYCLYNNLLLNCKNKEVAQIKDIITNNEL
jgi:hypothetical protein